MSSIEIAGAGAATDSLVARGLTGTVRQIKAHHHMDKLNSLTTL